MDVTEYMSRACVCGEPRSAHFHAFTESGELRVVGTRCRGYLDAIELELGGNPALNPLLRPLIARSAEAAGVVLPPFPEKTEPS